VGVEVAEPRGGDQAFPVDAVRPGWDVRRIGDLPVDDRQVSEPIRPVARVDDQNPLQEERRGWVVERPESAHLARKEEDRHADRHAIGDLCPDQAALARRQLGGDLDPFVGGTGVQEGCRGSCQPHARLVEAPGGGVVSQRPAPARWVALDLDPQRHHRIGIGQGALQPFGDGHPRPADEVGYPRPRPGQPDRCAQGRQRMHVRPRHPGMEDVADDDDLRPVQAPQRLAQRQGIEQRLGRVGMGAVAGIHNPGSRRARGEVRGAAHRMAQDDGGDPGPFQRPQRVHQRLALGHAAGLDREVDDLGAEGSRRQFEADPGAGRRLAEGQPDDLPAQQVDRLASGATLAHLDRQVETGFQLRAG